MQTINVTAGHPDNYCYLCSPLLSQVTLKSEIWPTLVVDNSEFLRNHVLFLLPRVYKHHIRLIHVTTHDNLTTRAFINQILQHLDAVNKTGIQSVKNIIGIIPVFRRWWVPD